MHEDYGYPDPADITPEIQAALDQGMAMDEAAEARGHDDDYARPYLELMRAWDSLMNRWGRMVEGVRALRVAWPGTWIVLIGLLPRRVWHVMAPMGSGPSFETPADAAEFITIERESATDSLFSDEERQDYENAPDFTPAELKPLWRPGAQVERNDWAIKCILLQRCRWGLHDWDGW